MWRRSVVDQALKDERHELLFVVQRLGHDGAVHVEKQDLRRTSMWSSHVGRCCRGIDSSQDTEQDHVREHRLALYDGLALVVRGPFAHCVAETALLENPGRPPGHSSMQPKKQ